MNRSLLIVLFFSLFPNLKADAQDTVRCDDLPAYVGRKVTIAMPVVEFDLRQDYIYLYMGNYYPNQKFTIIVKRNNGKKRIRLNEDIILGRAIASFTGYIAKDNEEPDTTKNYYDAAIKKEFEKEQQCVIMVKNQPATFYVEYNPRKGPIDLKGKLVMVIIQQKQIGAKHPIPSPQYSTYPLFNNTDDF